MNILITGVAGTGKTTLSRNLHDRGYSVVDDATNKAGIGQWFNEAGEKVSRLFAVKNNVEWNWDIERLQNFLNSHETAVVTGHTGDIYKQAQQYFDHLILLDTTPAVINQRLNTRPTGYGFIPSQRKLVLQDLDQRRREFKDLNAHIVDADQPRSELADSVALLIETIKYDS